jgi:hypothetical protein
MGRLLGLSWLSCAPERRALFRGSGLQPDSFDRPRFGPVCGANRADTSRPAQLQVFWGQKSSMEVRLPHLQVNALARHCAAPRSKSPGGY